MIMLPKALADNHAPRDLGSTEAPADPTPAGGPLQALEHGVAGAVVPQPSSNGDAIASGRVAGDAHDIAVEPTTSAPATTTTTTVVATTVTATPTTGALAPTSTDTVLPTTTDAAIPTTTETAAPTSTDAAIPTTTDSPVPSTSAPATTIATSATTATTTPTTSAAPQPTGIAQQMADAVNAISPGSNIGIEVVDTETGTVLATLNTDKQFYTASVVKLLIALDHLQSHDWQPDPATDTLLRRMLEASDDDIANQLWDSNGGNAIVDRMVSLIGLSGTQAPDDQYEWGETRTTPEDVVAIYQYISNNIPAQDRALILGSLRGTNEISADGTNQFFGIPSGLTGHSWAIKQGWMTLDDSTTLDTTGLVGVDPEHPLRYAVVMLTQQPAETSWATGGAALTAGVAVLHGLLR